MEKNKNILIGVGIVLVIMILSMINKSNTPSPNIETADSTLDTSTSTVNTAPQMTISYANALVKYKNFRVQLDERCQGSPDKMTFKNGTSIMVDNRSQAFRTVKVGSTFSIKPYGFKIVKLYSDTLPATWYVDCDVSHNVSTILIQK